MYVPFPILNALSKVIPEKILAEGSGLYGLFKCKAKREMGNRLRVPCLTTLGAWELELENTVYLPLATQRVSQCQSRC